MAVAPIRDVVSTVPGLSGEQRASLEQNLIARENEMADQFRMAGMQFGMFPQIIAEVFAEVGIGTPVNETERLLIHAQFVALMEELERQHREHGGQ